MRGPGTIPNWQSIGDWLSDQGLGVGDSGWGLYVATERSGGEEAVDFWTDAHERGLAFSNPRAFPTTIVNALAGEISRTLGIDGPNYTFVGLDSALLEASKQARVDLDEARVPGALVVQIDESPGQRHVKWVVLS